MRFPWRLTRDLTLYVMRNRLRGRKRFPLVLMLEPTQVCQLSCFGCGRIREYEATIRDYLSLEKALAYVDECAAPVVSICGGEPTLYPWITELIQGILQRKRHIMLCTNGIKLPQLLPKWNPSPYLTVNVSMDGLAGTHDVVRTRKGLYDLDIKVIKQLKGLGYRVVTNSTVYRNTDLDELEQMWTELEAIGVDGFLVSPGYHYEAVKRDDIFLRRKEMDGKFARIEELGRRFRFNNTPIYFQYLSGKRDLPCTPWGNITVNPQGWKGPCYVITDAHYRTFQDLMSRTDWDKFEAKADPRCTDCKMHSGFEATAVRKSGESWADLWEMIRWSFS